MKVIQLGTVGEIQVRKSARAKRIILRINHLGKPVLTIPSYTPYYMAQKFLQANTDWLIKHLPPETTDSRLHEGTLVGRTHTLIFKKRPAPKVSSRVQNQTITVTLPPHLDIQSKTVQLEAQKAATRALKVEAELHLPKILYNLAQKHGYSYKEVRVKVMHSRWGSCSTNKIINLSIWLMQLDDDLIEYVCCHELVHLVHQHHQPAFWNELEKAVPDYKERRKKLRQYKPALKLL